MCEFDASCLTTVKELSPKQITAMRKREGVSEAVFASSLNVTTGVVSKGEHGDKRPHGPALTLRSRVQKKGLDAIA